MEGVDTPTTVLGTDPYSRSSPATVWDRVEELVGRAPSVQALRAHRLHLVAARVLDSRGCAVPAELRADERRAGMISMAARPLLERARAAYGGGLMLMKGAEVAAHYRHQSDRFFCDLDLLADDAPGAQRALIKAGFVQCGDPATYEHAQHLCPLVWPGVPLFVELHRRPNSPAWVPQRTAAELFELSVPSATGVDGLLAPDPAAHAVLLVAHTWAEAPLGRIADLVDVAAVLGDHGSRASNDLARRWGWEGMWRVALRAGDAVLGDRAWPASLTVWASHLQSARDRTVLENHIARIAAPACALPVALAPVVLAAAIRPTASRRNGEPWSDKLRRARLAVAHAFMARSAHDHTVSQRRIR